MTPHQADDGDNRCWAVGYLANTVSPATTKTVVMQQYSMNKRNIGNELDESSQLIPCPSTSSIVCPAQTNYTLHITRSVSPPYQHHFQQSCYRCDGFFQASSPLLLRDPSSWASIFTFIVPSSRSRIRRYPRFLSMATCTRLRIALGAFNVEPRKS